MADPRACRTAITGTIPAITTADACIARPAAREFDRHAIRRADFRSGIRSARS